MEILEVESTRGIKPALIALLQDCVASGASVGFLPPLQEEQGLAYWQGIEGSWRMECASSGWRLISTIWWAPCSSPCAQRPTGATGPKWKS